MLHSTVSLVCLTSIFRVVHSCSDLLLTGNVNCTSGRLTKSGSSSSYADNFAVTARAVVNFSLVAAAPDSISQYYVRFGLTSTSSYFAPSLVWSRPLPQPHCVHWV